MPRYVAFLRGVMPTNARMPALKAAFEAAGFQAVRTVLASGNVVFDSDLSDEDRIKAQSERGMHEHLPRTFPVVIRSVEHLQRLLATDPYTAHGIPPEARRVICFLPRATAPRVALPLAEDLASVFLVDGREAYAAYVTTPKGPVFMKLIERAFGQDVTTRTVDTVARCAAA